MIQIDINAKNMLLSPICRQFVAKQNKIVAQNPRKYLFINEYKPGDKSKILKLV